MKKIKLIKKIGILTLIGGGLTSIPFLTTSCSYNGEKVSIISVDTHETLINNAEVGMA
jgi:hypothetical protein